MAIDRDAIIKDVYLGAGETAKTLIPPTMWSLQRRDRRLPVRSREGQGDARRGRRQDAARHRPLVSAGAAPLQPERQAHRRDDAGRPRQDRRQRQARHLRMGRVPQAPAERRGRHRADGLDRRQRRPRQLLLPARLRRTASRPATTSRSGATRSSTTCSPRRGRSPTRPSAPSSTPACRRSSTTKRRRC